MDIKELRDEYLKQKVVYEQSVKQSEIAKENMKELFSKITEEQKQFCLDNNIPINSFVNIDLDRVCTDIEYRDQCITLQHEIVQKLHEFLEGVLDV